MSEMTSSYTIDLIVKGDKTKDAIREIEKDIKRVGESNSISDATKSVEKMLMHLSKSAKDASIDAQSVVSYYSTNSKKALSALESEYIRLRKTQENASESKSELIAQKEKLEVLRRTVNTTEEAVDISFKLKEINDKIAQIDDIPNQIEKNRQLRYQIKAAAQFAQKELYLSQIEQKQNKAQSLSIKEKIKYFMTQRVQNNADIKALKEKIRLLENEEKQEKKIGQAIKNVSKEQENATKKQGGRLQSLYNITGLIGGGGRTIGAGVKAVAAGGKFAAGMIGGAVQAAAQTADREVEKERQANRIKGYSTKEARDILGELYIRTGADYSQIVDAINRVQTTLKGAAKDDIMAAAEIELRYPGMSLAFASESGTNKGGVDVYKQYAAKLKAIQKASGASDEQIAASIQKFSNEKDLKFSGSAVSDFQAVYLSMQNSGAFETDDELDRAFKIFVRKQQGSGKGVFEFAKDFDWSVSAQGDRNKAQVRNSMRGFDWSTLTNEISSASSGNVLDKTESEEMATNMRRMEEQKNKLLMTLIPAAIPLVEAFSKMLDGGGAKLIADGLNSLFTLVVPVLLKVLEMLNDYILTPLLKAINAVVEWFGDESGGDTGAIPQNANGGIAIGPSIVGERSFQPEMILPLDYSRASRAGNIIQSVSQTFNMSGSETTALSLSQAVKSRDFRRATAQSAFISARGGLL